MVRALSDVRDQDISLRERTDGGAKVEQEAEMLTIGQAMKAARKRSGLSQYRLSSLTGITREAISNYERDITNPQIFTVCAIADALNMSIDELVGRRADNA